MAAGGSTMEGVSSARERDDSGTRRWCTRCSGCALWLLMLSLTISGGAPLVAARRRARAVVPHAAASSTRAGAPAQEELHRRDRRGRAAGDGRDARSVGEQPLGAAEHARRPHEPRHLREQARRAAGQHRRAHGARDARRVQERIHQGAPATRARFFSRASVSRAASPSALSLSRGRAS